MKKSLIAIAALFTLTGCSPVITQLLPSQEPEVEAPEPQPSPLTPLYVMRTCPEALAIHPDFVLLAKKCPNILMAILPTLGHS